MKKEQLTEENIKSDIKYQIKCGYISILICLVFFAVFMLFSRAVKSFEFEPLYNFTLIMALLMVFGAIESIIIIINRYIILRNKIIVVRDSLYDKWTRGHRDGRGRIHFTCHFCFYRNGKYQLPKIVNIWSENYCISDERMYELSDCGDVFYLVLSRGKKGKVLFAYNGKMFDPMPENSVDKTSQI